MLRLGRRGIFVPGSRLYCVLQIQLLNLAEGLNLFNGCSQLLGLIQIIAMGVGKSEGQKPGVPVQRDVAVIPSDHAKQIK